MNHAAAISDQGRLGLLIEPLDTLFFRDGRPFGPADHGQSGLPMPQTLAGMIKFHLLSQAGVDAGEIHNLRQNPNHAAWWTSQVAVRGPWLARQGPPAAPPNLYFPAPAHLVRTGRGVDAPLTLLAPLNEQVALPGWGSPSPHFERMRPLIALGDHEVVEPAGGWLNLEGLRQLLAGKVPVSRRTASGAWDPDSPWLPESELLGYEDRVGIGIDPATLATVEGLIYSAGHLRLRDGERADRIVLYAEVGWENAAADSNQLAAAFPAAGVALPFGGEGRRVRVRPVTPLAWPEASATPAPEAGGWTTLLVSPAIFHPREGTARPAWQPPDLGVLRGAAVPKPLAVSGWDLGDKVPRPTRYALRAGSVFFWQNGKNADPERAQPGLVQLAEKPADRAAGWGLALRGCWKWA